VKKNQPIENQAVPWFGKARLMSDAEGLAANGSVNNIGTKPSRSTKPDEGR
jgi:hypothetical protein